MTLAKKIILSFVALITMLCVVAGTNFYALSREHSAFAHYVEDEAHRLALAHEMLDAANARAVSARNLVLVQADAERQREKAKVDAAHARVERTLVALKAAVAKGEDHTAEEQRLMKTLDDVERRYGAVALKIVALAMDGARDDAVGRMERECRPLLDELIAAANAYSAYIAKEAELAVAASGAAYHRSVALVAALLVLAVGLAMVMARALVVGITRPLRHAVDVARAVADGNLAVRTETTRRDEVGELLQALHDMARQLSGLVQRVRQGSDSISTGSREIAAGSLDLSQRTERQAGELQATASSMEQMSANVRSNAAVASQASSLATSAARAAVEGGSAVDQVVKTMQGIADSARQIAEINAVIDGIAFQTNILALNAAVEAARAGENGRGFAVVASEVRALAGRSAEAARQIKTLITGSVARVDEGSRVVGDAGEKMQAIVQQVREVATLIEQIGTSAAEQTSGIGQVTASVAALDQGTQQNAALVEQSSAAAESLKHQAEQLVQAVAVFRVA